MKSCEISNSFSIFSNYTYIVVFATGKNFLYFEKQFEDTIITSKQIFVVDNDQLKVGSEISLWGKNCIIHNLYELRTLVELKEPSLAIIITCNAYKEIVCQLEKDDTLKKIDTYFFKDIDPVSLYFPATRKYKLLNKWLCLKNAGKSICDAKPIKDSNKIAFYGLEDFGKRFVEDLYSRDKKISFCIVEKQQTFFTDFDVYCINDNLPICDVFVITDIERFDMLRKKLQLSSETEVYAIDSLLEEVWTQHWGMI